MNNSVRALACCLGLCLLALSLCLGLTLTSGDAVAQATNTMATDSKPSAAKPVDGEPAIDPNSDEAPMDWGDALKPTTTAQPQDTEKRTSTFQKVAQVFLGLVVVIALIVALGYVAKMLMPKQTGGGNQALMEVLCKQFIDPKHKLVAVKINQRVLIVGVSPNQITHLLEITDPAEVATFTDTYSLENNPANRLFNKMLKRDIDKLGTGTTSAEGTPIATADSESDLGAKINAIRDDLKTMRKDS